jgi:glycosyltransferase involved in cell wall biosynthesis
VSGVRADPALGSTGSAVAESANTIKTAVVGVSTSPTCGVRDHAVLLAGALARENVSCSLHWLRRTDASLRTGRFEIRDWTRILHGELVDAEPDVALLHYSVFAYSYRGLPLFIDPTLRALRALGIPLVTILHEFAYPWRRGSARGIAWALSQRALLLDVMRTSCGVVLTANSRAEWLASRPWLPQRPAVVAPVFSNLPPPGPGVRPDRGEASIGLFGYAYEGAAVSVVLDAVEQLKSRGTAVRLILLGAPGRHSKAAEEWSLAARARGIQDALSFSGTLPEQDLSDALAACDVLLSADPSGPTPRKTTLAASLASGRPLVAIDGAQSWRELIDSRAALLVRPTAFAVADALGGLLEDQGSREALGSRGRAFAHRTMSVERSAEVVARLLHEIARGSSS